MKFHSTAPALNLKWAKQTGEKAASDTIKPDPKAFKAALVSAAAEEQPAVKNENAKKRLDDCAQKPREGQAAKSGPDGKKQGSANSGKTAAAFYPVALSNAINNALPAVKTIDKAKTAVSPATANKVREIKAETLPPESAGAANYVIPAKARTAARQETPPTKQETAGSKQEATGSKQGEPITSISVTSSKAKDDGAKSDDKGRDGQNIFKPAGQISVYDDKKTALPEALNANAPVPAKEVIKDIAAQLKASFYRAPEKGVEYTAVIKLSPPSLGAVEIRTVLKPDETISVKITAANNDTISMLTAKLDTLKQELSGVFAGSAGQLDVNVGAQEQDPRNFSGAPGDGRGEEHIYQDSAYSHSTGPALRPAAYIEKNSYLI
jgi:hypothetical protein